MLLVVLLLPKHHMNPLVIVPLHCSFTLLVVTHFAYVVGEVLLPSSSPCRWLVSGPLCCYMCPTTRYPFTPPLVLLLFHCVDGVGVGFLCCFFHGEVLPPPMPCVGGGALP
jgi:hypothetical protein